MTTAPAEPCKSCGLPTTAKSGYCKRTKTCDAARHRAEYTAEKGFAKYKPDEPRYRCFDCGNYLKLGTSLAIPLCPDCQLHPRLLSRRVAKAEAMLAYGDGCCACCGETNLDFLTLDHVNGDGAQKRADGALTGATSYSWLKRRAFPDRDQFQVLCFNCNCAKGVRGGCPCATYRRSPRDFLAPGQLPLF
jgi:hypothetical protein